MKNQGESVCIRCGKQRVVAKTWEEHLRGSILTFTSFICPDPRCQKIVDKQLADKKEKRETAEKEREERKHSKRPIPQVAVGKNN